MRIGRPRQTSSVRSAESHPTPEADVTGFAPALRSFIRKRYLTQSPPSPAGEAPSNVHANQSSSSTGLLSGFTRLQPHPRPPTELSDSSPCQSAGRLRDFPGRRAQHLLRICPSSSAQQQRCTHERGKGGVRQDRPQNGQDRNKNIGNPEAHVHQKVHNEAPRLRREHRVTQVHRKALRSPSWRAERQDCAAERGQARPRL
eukprot:scaffold574_cov246-Pinguiococcus_pyrenoidosus.AAC.6